MPGQTNSQPIDEHQRGICTLAADCFQREQRRREAESGKVNLSKSLLYGVCSERALHNGFINGIMSRRVWEIITHNLALSAYQYRSVIADD